MPKVLRFPKIKLSTVSLKEGELYCTKCKCHIDGCMCMKPPEEVEVSQEEYDKLVGEQSDA